MKKWLTFFGGLLLLGFLLTSGTFYIVPVNQHAVVTRFGKIVRVHSTPGVHVKVPFLDVVYAYPKWLQEHDSAPVETVLGDKRNVIFDTFLLCLFTLDGVVRVGLAQRVDDFLLGGTINLGNVVLSLFLVHLDAIQAFDGAENQFTGAASGAQGDIQHRLHGRVTWRC